MNVNIRQRLSDKETSVRVRFQKVIKEYKKYYSSIKLNEEETNKIYHLFEEDIVILLRDSSDKVESGGKLSSLLGLDSAPISVRKTSDEFSLLMKKVLKLTSKETTVTISTSKEFDNLYKAFITELKIYVFSK